MQNLKIFKIRCSQIARIMSEPRAKKDKEAGNLSKTTESYVHEWLTEQIYGVRKPLDTKEINKGHLMENEAIQLLGEKDKAFYMKNETHLDNDYMTGTPDIITKEEIIDIKCPWDCYTFPTFETKLNPMYYWQMQGYMNLTGKARAKVVYCLMNTPLDLAYSELDCFDYTELPISKRIKTFEVERNQQDINRIVERVRQIRNYISNLQI